MDVPAAVHGRDAVKLFERLAEVVLAGKAGLLGNLLQREGSADQQVARVFQTDFRDKVFGRGADGTVEQVAQRARPDPERIGQCLHSYRAEVAADVVSDLRNEPSVVFGAFRAVCLAHDHQADGMKPRGRRRPAFAFCVLQAFVHQRHDESVPGG